MDERVAVASAIAHWAPRFTANGVTVSDFESITSGLERWADWCAAWSSAGAEYEALGRAALAEGRLLSAGEHLARAAVHFHFGKTKLVGGVSLGGYDAPRVAAALGDRVKACVALSGPYDFDECWGQLPQLTRRAFEVRSGGSGEEDARRIAGTLSMDGPGRGRCPDAREGNHGCADVVAWHRRHAADWLAARL